MSVDWWHDWGGRSFDIYRLHVRADEDAVYVELAFIGVHVALEVVL